MTCVAFSRDGRRLAGGSADHTATVWDTASGELLLTVRDGRADVASVAFSPDGTRLAAAAGSAVVLWDLRTGQAVFRRLQGRPVAAVAFSPDGTRLAAAGEDRTVTVWDARP